MAYLPICFAALMYALTGTPSSGKTSIIQELEKRGEKVIHEAATDLIKEKINSGIADPWKAESFPLEVLKIQMQREQPWLPKNDRVFIDRGIFDCYAFAMTDKLAETQTLVKINNILNPIDLNKRYKAVFFITPHSQKFSPHQTEIRCQDDLEAAKLEVATYAIYCRHNHFIIVPGDLTPKQRADFILEKIQKLKRPN